VLPSDFSWSDIGSWKSLYDFLEKDENNNVLDGDIIARNTHNCFVLGHDRLIATNRLQDVVVVETPDSIFVSDLEHSRDVRSIVVELKSRGREEYQQHRTVYHPWGIAKLLERRDDYTAVELTIYPHRLRQLSEADDRIVHFFVVRGTVQISTASEKKSLSSGDSFSWQAQGQVSIENRGQEDVRLIQVALCRH
jgi:mannose-1-phosphate guanylyltransferase